MTRLLSKLFRHATAIGSISGVLFFVFYTQMYDTHSFVLNQLLVFFKFIIGDQKSDLKKIRARNLHTFQTK